MIDWIQAFLLSSLRLSTPLIFAAMGALISERSGVVTICVEGYMLMGAFFGAVAALATGSEWMGLLAAAGAGAVTALLYGVFVLRWGAEQIVAGTGINLAAAGVGPVLSKIWYDSSLGTPHLGYDERFGLFPSVLSFGLVLALFGWLRYTAGGLWLTFAGENPTALKAAGVAPGRVRWVAVVLGGLFAGIGGGTLSLALSSSFVQDMTAGRGFMALAAVILGRWHPLWATAACLFFGATDALQMRLQGMENLFVPIAFVQILPYLITLVVLAGIVGRSRGPAALGKGDI